ncbi:hypothetical protein [Leptolyngbya sp. 7M]|uniref:hypothetical protein n=1 Tax=Leptolyngbya sp. 7M TaxID=2812896 RepID=UPI001B8B5070|nr:hypothetical protein [Leptolyngbya sp. 7M]QYO64299.1 hypothetical protein JVX88_32035 [Leptolyngbya sp. 7M]
MRAAENISNTGKHEVSDSSASQRLEGSFTWLFSRNIDLSVFLGSAVVSLLLLAVGWQLGILDEASPEWTWVTAVLRVVSCSILPSILPHLFERAGSAMFCFWI